MRQQQSSGWPAGGFADIHAHVLPGLDDGPPEEAQSLAMLEMAHGHGTSVLVASPHANPFYHYDPDLVEELIDRLKPQAPPGLSLIRGCDFHLTFNNVENALRCPANFSINGRSYLLMELSELTVFANTDVLWGRLEEAGLRIILTHPERNALLRQRLDLIERWVDAGRYMQLTAGSLLGRFGPEAQRFAFLLLDRGLAHFVASDAHDLRHRPPRLDEAYCWLEGRYGRQLAEQLTVNNPLAAVEGRPIPPGRMAVPKPLPRRSWWRRVIARQADGR